MWGVIARIAAAAVVVAAVQHQLGSIYDAWRSDVTGTDGATKFFTKTEGDDDVAGTGERSGDGDGKEKGLRGKSGSRWLLYTSPRPRERQKSHRPVYAGTKKLNISTNW